jgi:Secretion system C-terminal sorting domain
LFWNLGTDGLQVVGIKIDAALGGALNFNDPWLELKLPCTYGTTWSDPTGDTYTASGFPVVRTGTVTGNADAYGSLELPLGAVYPEVLRVHVRREITDAAAVVTTNRIANVYSYYITTQTTPVVILQTDSTRINAGAWAITKRQLAVGSPGMVGTSEFGADEVSFTAYPNPASDAITLSAGGSGTDARRVQLLNGLGRIVLEETLVGDKSSIAVNGLAAGLYSLRLLSGEKLIGTSRITVQ